MIKNNEDKISHVTNLATKTTLNAKINKVKGEIPSITNLATTTALTPVENEILNVSDLVKKKLTITQKLVKLKKITAHVLEKYIITLEFNRLTAEHFAARLAQANLVNENDIANVVNKTDFGDKLKKLNKKVPSNKIKYLIVENELKKLQAFDSSLFISQSYFNNYKA